ncbi:hypothetical protein V1512DRAFT_209354 [Lipomyces arxii]|uniref:uncharacterized protein n=1 Tax=Lipomyces arxii TaxID=56418 RepID=UPI0034CEC2FA
MVPPRIQSTYIPDPNASAASYDPTGITTESIYSDPGMMTVSGRLAPSQPMQQQYYSPTTTNLFEAAAFGSHRTDPYVSTSMLDEYSPGMNTTNKNYADVMVTENGDVFESDSDADGWSHSRKNSKRKKSGKDGSKRPRISQARPHFANDKPIVVNPDREVFWFVQAKNCQSMSVGIRRCRACTRRKSGVGACRFIGVRVFREDVSGVGYDGEDPDYAFCDQLNQSQQPSDQKLGIDSDMLLKSRVWHPPYLNKIQFSVPPASAADLSYVLDAIAPVFSQVLEQEIDLENQQSLLRIVPKGGEGYKSLCDICSTSLFSGRYMCYYCGLEMCLDCYNHWSELGDEDTNAKLSRNTVRFVFEFCAYGNRHQQKCLIPVSRMMPRDLAEIYNSVRQRLPHSVPLRQLMSPFEYSNSDFSVISDPTPIHFQDGELSTRQFREQWKQCLPLVIHGTGSKLKVDWTAAGFIERSGFDPCRLVDENGDAFDSTVGQFFEGFSSGQFGGFKVNLKLKDWPTNGDLKDSNLQLLADFEQAMPFPIYTRREGFMNLASMFPKDFNPPDLGPKLYNAYASSHIAHGRGTTNLHLDIADALNLMACSVANGTGDQLENLPGANSGRGITEQAIGAVWDIFRAEDCVKLRQFILEREQEEPVLYNNPYLKREKTKAAKDKDKPKIATDDPIHRQLFYLTDPELIMLRQRHGVVPFRIWQKPGDAVMIPAGCPHQVCNISSCVNAAINFVSPENLERCMEIMQETRLLAKVRKKEDVLQLKQILYFACIKATDLLEKFETK